MTTPEPKPIWKKRHYGEVFDVVAIYKAPSKSAKAAVDFANTLPTRPGYAREFMETEGHTFVIVGRYLSSRDMLTEGLSATLDKIDELETHEDSE